MMKKYLMQCLLAVGLCLSSPLLYGQSNLESLQQVQFLSQNICVVVQVNADWNKSSSIDIGHMFVKGKEIKRFEAGLSFTLDRDDIKEEIEEEIDKIMLRRFQ